ncbi:hypothetical protein DPEC_G00196530 [Dallia pectoralis]|uniref:Uncharacterized protein n=1 Tax=Dallia pectoralis TaxID=75939 RepID=A0ACC2G7M2_DALPE|nr:hypothetical protein DPEC_G00196530 [Dallia pectoralis]
MPCILSHLSSLAQHPVPPHKSYALLWLTLSIAAHHQEDQIEPPPVPKKPGKGRPALGREKSADSVSSTSSAEKQRTEARKRLLAAKRAASVRQNSATESADSIEIYVPEAQTRL